MHSTFLLRKTLRSENKTRGHSGVDALHITVIKSLCNYAAPRTLLQGRKGQRPGRLGRVRDERDRGHWAPNGVVPRRFWAITTTPQSFIPSLYNDHCYKLLFLVNMKSKAQGDGEDLPGILWYSDTCVLKLCSLCARGPLRNRKLKLSILSWLLLLPPSPAQHYLLPQECWCWMFLEEASLLFSVSFPTLLSSLPSRFSFINSFHKE